MRLDQLLLPLLAIILVVMMTTRARRQRQLVAELQNHVVVGQRIMTTGGLYATVVGVDDDTVTLETAPGQHSRWSKQAIMRKLPPEEVQTDGEPAETPESSPEPAEASAAPHTAQPADEDRPPGQA